MTDAPPRHCLRCGYDNSATLADDVCPECGVAPPWSRGAPLARADPSVRKAFASAFMLMSIAAWCSALEPVINTMWAYELLFISRGKEPPISTHAVDYYFQLLTVISIGFFDSVASLSASAWRMTRREAGDPMRFSTGPAMRWLAFAILVPPVLNLVWTFTDDRSDWFSAWMYWGNDALAALLLIAIAWCWMLRAPVVLRRVDPIFATRFRRAVRKRMLLVVVLWGASIAVPLTPFGFANHEEQLVLRPVTALMLISIGRWCFSAWRRIAKA